MKKINYSLKNEQMQNRYIKGVIIVCLLLIGIIVFAFFSFSVIKSYETTRYCEKMLGIEKTGFFGATSGAYKFTRIEKNKFECCTWHGCSGDNCNPIKKCGIFER